MKLKDLCKESPEFKAKIVSVVLAGPMGAFDRNTGKPTFRGQLSAHEYCKRNYLTTDELVSEIYGDVSVPHELRESVYGLLHREYVKGRMKRKRHVCSITDRDCWGYKSII